MTAPLPPICEHGIPRFRCLDCRVTTRRRAPSMPTLSLSRGRFSIGRPGSDRDPEDAVATVGCEEGAVTALVDLTEGELVEIRDWVTAYLEALRRVG
jgi:hypothetical protein